MTKEVVKKEEEKEGTEVVPSRGKEIVPRDINRMMEQFDRMFDEVWRQPFPSFSWPFPSMPRLFGGLPTGRLSMRTPAVDVFEDENDVVVKAEVPGLEKSDLSVNLTASTLTITGEKKKEEKVKEEDYAYSERSYGKFSRSVTLPCEVKSDKAKATFKNGVLEIWLPKTEEAKKRQYTVKIE